MIRAGLLDRAVTFQTRTVVPDAQGVPVEVWSNGPTVSANVMPVSMNERFQYEGQRVTRVQRVLVRYFLPFNTADFRLVYEGDVYQIRGFSEVGRREGWSITAEFME